MDNPKETKIEHSDAGPPAVAESMHNRKQQWIHFSAGFLGWFILYGLIWWRLVETTPYGQWYLYDVCLLPLNVLLMIVLARNIKTRFIGIGILVAMAVNLIISLVMGLGMEAICNIPFFAME